MEAIELKAKNSDLKIFPLLKRIQDGVLLDKKLASKFGVEKSLVQALELTDELLIKCQFIEVFTSGLTGSQPKNFPSALKKRFNAGWRKNQPVLDRILPRLIIF